MKSGVYETMYGNAVEYVEGDDFGIDLDMGETIPVEFIDFDQFIREIE